jgi:hypothetical protein
VPGNGVKQGQLGEEGQLSCFFDDTKKWGIYMDEGDQIMIHQANLLRTPVMRDFIEIELTNGIERAVMNRAGEATGWSAEGLDRLMYLRNCLLGTLQPGEANALAPMIELLDVL